MAGVSTTNSSNTADADGSTTVFNYTFFVYSTDHIKVYSVLDDVLTPVTTGITKAINSSFIGGTVTFAVAPADAVGDILIRREVPYTQETEFADLTRYKETATEAALNSIVLQIQQLAADSALSLKYNENAGVSDSTIEAPVDGSVLIYDGLLGRVKGALLASLTSDIDTVLSGLASGDFLQYNGTAWENITAAELMTALGVSAYIQTLLNDADAATARGTLGAAASGANSDITALAAITSINGGGIAGRKNPLINPAFAINQRAAASNADDTYAHDRWYVLTQTGAIAVSTVTAAEDGTPYMARLTQSQASAQRMGYAQIIEGINCKHLRGKQVTFNFERIRCSSSQAIRFAVLEWTGTEDAVTSDVVLDWTSGSYTAGGFFLASNLVVSGVAAQTPAAATLANGTALTVTLGSTFNNLIVFAWTEGTAAQNVTLDLAKAQINQGAVAPTFQHPLMGSELALCQRYCYVGRYPSGSQTPVCYGQAGTATVAYVDHQLPVPMRSRPTGLTVSAAGDFQLWNATTGTLTCTAVAYAYSSDNIVTISATVASGLVSGNATSLRALNANAVITYTGAEL